MPKKEQRRTTKKHQRKKRKWLNKKNHQSHFQVNKQTSRSKK